MSTPQKAANMVNDAKEAWQDPKVAERYQRAEAATRPFAQIIIEKSSIASSIAQHNSTPNVLDFGCGTGVVTAVLHDTLQKEHWSQLKVLGADISQPMLTYLENRAKENGWPGVTTQIVDGTDIQLAQNQFTHIIANAIIFFLPLGALNKLYDLLQPGGFYGMTTWSSFGWYENVKRAFTNLGKESLLPTLEEARNTLQRGNPWHEPDFVRQQLEEAGFKDLDFVLEKKSTPAGTPAEFCEAMGLPIKMFSGSWDEATREEDLKLVMAELRKVMVEVAGGEEEMVYLEMGGIVATGWKPTEN